MTRLTRSWPSGTSSISSLAAIRTPVPPSPNSATSFPPLSRPSSSTSSPPPRLPSLSNAHAGWSKTSSSSTTLTLANRNPLAPTKPGFPLPAPPLLLPLPLPKLPPKQTRPLASLTSMKQPSNSPANRTSASAAGSPDIERRTSPPLVPTTAPRQGRQDPLHPSQASNPSKKSRKTRGHW